jgi:hypothetical protein
MSRKRSKYRPREAKAPMIVIMESVPDLSLTERISVRALADGYATTDHFDNLADCRNMLTLASAERKDVSAQAVCELAMHALIGVREHYDESGQFAVTAEELAALNLLVDTSESFWKRQSGAMFARHYAALKQRIKAES